MLTFSLAVEKILNSAGSSGQAASIKYEKEGGGDWGRGRVVEEEEVVAPFFFPPLASYWV